MGALRMQEKIQKYGLYATYTRCSKAPSEPVSNRDVGD